MQINSYDEYLATLDERIESGEIGDVVLISSEQLPEYVEKGWILDLSSDAEGIIDYTSASFDRLYPSEEYMEAAYNASLYEGRMYMCPVEYLNQVVILNLDLLEAAGLRILFHRTTGRGMSCTNMRKSFRKAAWKRPS